MCGEPNGKVVADRGSPGAWETWTAEHVQGNQFYFKNAHGHYLHGEPNTHATAQTTIPVS